MVTVEPRGKKMPIWKDVLVHEREEPALPFFGLFAEFEGHLQCLGSPEVVPAARALAAAPSRVVALVVALFFARLYTMPCRESPSCVSHDHDLPTGTRVPMSGFGNLSRLESGGREGIRSPASSLRTRKNLS